MTATSLDRILADAALMGLFRPEDLLACHQVAAPDQDTLVAGLAPQCEEQIRDGIWYWQLTPDARRGILARLGRMGVLDRLGNLPPCQPWDGFGPCLRLLVQGQPVPEPQRPGGTGEGEWIDIRHRHHVTLLAAVEFAEVALPSDALRDLKASTQDRIKLLSHSRALHQALPTRLFGRRAERRRIYDFLSGRTFRDRPAMLLTGIGGAGKSAMLAHVMKHWPDRQDAPVLIHLDFDRQLLRRGEPAWIAAEILRQMMAALVRTEQLQQEARRALHDGLDRLRGEIRRLSDTDKSSSFLGQISRILSYMTTAFQEIWARGIRKQRVAVLMDSFEAIGPADGPAVQSVLRLVGALSTVLPGFKVLISGRGVPVAATAVDSVLGTSIPRIHLRGLDPEAGADLLGAEDRAGFFPDRATRRKAAEQLDNFPLALIVLGRYVADLPGGTTAQDLLQDLQDDEGFKAELAHVFLFRRILDRILDPDAGRLAHPGLVLRQLNADLIRLILAEPCLGRPLTGTQANALTARLADEYWLVRPVSETDPDSPYDLRHDPELRRPMIDHLFAAPGDPPAGATPRQRERAAQRRAMAHKARDVARKAAAFYRDGPPPGDPATGWWTGLGPDIRAAEATYYGALAGEDPAPDLDAVQVRTLREVLGADLDTLPPRWTRTIAALEGGGLTLDEEAILTGQAASATRRTRQEAVAETGNYDPQFVRFEAVDRPDASLRDLGQELVNTFNAARFDDPAFARLCTRYLDTLLPAIHPDYFDGTPDRFRQPIWIAMLAQTDRPLPDPARFWVRAPAAGPPDPDRPDDPARHAALAALLDPWGRTLSSRFRLPVERNRIELAKFAALSGGRLFRGQDGEPANISLDAMGLSLAASDTAPIGGMTVADAFPNTPARTRQPPIPLGELVPRPAPPEEALTIRAVDQAYGPQTVLIDFAELEALCARNPRLAARMLRGRTPELVEPATTLIVQQSTAVIADITDRFAAGNRLWPGELRFGKANPYRDIHAGSLSDMADKFGLMGDLCRLLAQADDRASRLVFIHDRITRWFYGDLDLGETG